MATISLDSLEPLEPLDPPEVAEGVEPAVAHRRLARVARAFGLARRTLAAAWGGRILGLSAEAAFWQLLSLAPLLLALLGLIGYLESWLGTDAVASVRKAILNAATQVLLPSAVDDVVRPTLDNVLGGGRADLVSVGFALSLWSGSSALATFVNTITIAYGQRDLRGAIRSRLLALFMYLSSLVGGAVLLPALALGPGLLTKLGRGQTHTTIAKIVHYGYVPLVSVVGIGLLMSLYHFALPRRRPWRRALPGALLALVVWLVGSFALRTYLSEVFARTRAFGGIAAPVAVLLFFYVTAFAVLLGAFLNAQADRTRALRLGEDPVVPDHL